MKTAGIIALTALIAVAGAASGVEFRVLVVMSYEESNPWVKEIRQGVETVLGVNSDITYFHMDMKVNPDAAKKKAADAYDLYQKLRPHGVIATDDDAQTHFVVPYLRNKVTTPVMFNSVNANAQQYDFPASNVSGILERAHIRESLAFIKQLIPSIQTTCLLTNDVPAGQALRAQVEEEKSSYLARVNGIHHVKTTRELQALARGLRASCDSLFTLSIGGIVDDQSRPLNVGEILKVVSNLYNGPILGGNRYQVEQGAWAAVVKTGQEQGETSAEMLLRAMRGTPVSSLPVTQNMRGQRVINVSAMEAHGIPLRPMVIRGATLVRQQP